MSDTDDTLSYSSGEISTSAGFWSWLYYEHQNTDMNSSYCRKQFSCIYYCWVCSTCNTWLCTGNYCGFIFELPPLSHSNYFVCPPVQGCTKAALWFFSSSKSLQYQ